MTLTVAKMERSQARALKSLHKAEVAAGRLKSQLATATKALREIARFADHDIETECFAHIARTALREMRCET